MNIGFVGLGIMGGPMAGRLLDGGHTLFVNDVDHIPRGSSKREPGRCQAGEQRPRPPIS